MHTVMFTILLGSILARADSGALGVFDDLGVGSNAGARAAASPSVAGNLPNPFTAANLAQAARDTEVALATHALVVAGDAHVVLMEYEPVWGPNALQVTGVATPTLTSASMVAAGLRGYDSADPLVIAQHVRWMRAMSVDAISLDISNAAACTFNTDVQKFCGGDVSRQNYLREIRSNYANLYAEYRRTQVSIKIVPWLDGQEDDLYVPDADGVTAIEKELRFYTGLIEEYPELAVLYEGRPLVNVYLNSPARQDLVPKIWSYVTAMQMDRRFTFRFSTGFTDTQPNLWDTSNGLLGLPRINVQQPLWSVIDRLRPGVYQPAYHLGNGRVEQFTATVAFGGLHGWSDPTSGLRDDGRTFQSFVDMATQLKPTFLTVAIFNEYGPPDQGDDAEHNSNIEPTDLWGTTRLDSVAASLAAYKKRVGGIVPSAATLASAAGEMFPGYFSASDRDGIFVATGTGHYCGFGSLFSFTESGGTGDRVRAFATVAPAMVYDGECSVNLRPGFFSFAGASGLFKTTGDGTYCGFATMESFLSAGGAADGSNVRALDAMPKGNRNVGACP